MYRASPRWIGLPLGVMLGVAALLATGERAIERGAFHVQWNGFGPADLGRLRSAKWGTIAPPDVISGALRAKPLAWEPFLAAGRAQDARGGDGRRLLLEAIRRNPHNAAPRLALISRAALRTDMPGLGEALIGLLHVAPATAETLAIQVGRAADTADHAREAVAALRPAPRLIAALIRGFVDPVHSPALIGAMLDSVPAATARDPIVRPTLIAALVQTGRYREAQTLWSSPPKVSGTPFDWQLADGPAGAARRVADGSLELVASGQGAGVLASRLLVLPARAASLELTYRPGGGDSGALQLRLRCAEDSRVLASQVLASDPATPLRSVFTFAVPTDHCSGQYLEFITQADTGGQPQRAEILGLHQSARAER